MSDLPRDPWQNVKTIHDFPADHVISALQKEIRRGHTENAVLLAQRNLAGAGNAAADAVVRTSPGQTLPTDRLGLEVAPDRIVGTLSVESTPGDGATFSFTLPGRMPIPPG